VQITHQQGSIQAELQTQRCNSLGRYTTRSKNQHSGVPRQQTDQHKSKKGNRQQRANQPGQLFEEQLHSSYSSSLRIQTWAQLTWATGIPSPRRPSGKVQSRRLRT